MKLEVHNNRVYLRGVNEAFVDLLDKKTAYRVKGYQFSPRYKDKTWDGKQHLVSYTSLGIYVPFGMIPDILSLAKRKNLSVKFVDKRRKLHRRLDLTWLWEDYEDRPYQLEAVKAITRKRGNGYTTGNGLLRLPMRSGKTVIAALAIADFDRPSLVIVNSDLLLRQTVELFRNIFQRKIGVIGGGTFQPEDITIATIQSLLRKKKKLDKGKWDVVFFDEIHHLADATKWRGFLRWLDARYKIGMSATFWLNRNKENEKGVIWLRASTGKILYEREISEMIEDGWLMRPKIFIYEVTTPNLAGVAWGGAGKDSLYSRAITYNKRFNRKVIELATDRLEAGKNVLITVRYVKHLQELAKLAEEIPFRFAAVKGGPGGNKRYILEQFERREIPLLIGTVFGEAVDMPNCEVVINAEGGKSRVSTYQRFRNLTKTEDKAEVEFIDFAFMNSDYLAKHSLYRLRAYQDESAFRVRAMGVI